MANASTYTPTQLRDYAWMSQAAYLDLDDPSANNIEGLAKLLTGGKKILNSDKLFASAQANMFTDANQGYGLCKQLPAQSSSGFSASLVKSASNGGYTLAIRGTDINNQLWNDLIKADLLGVVFSGQAKEQLFDAYRYYKQITTGNGVKVSYSSAELSALAMLVSGKADVSVLTNSKNVQADSGLGLVPSGVAVNFTGHSLGGHLAALLAEMVGKFQGKAAVGDVVSYNAPGLNALWNEAANWMGINTSMQSGVLGEKHLAVIAEPGVSVAAGLGSTNGTKQMVFIEESVHR